MFGEKRVSKDKLRLITEVLFLVVFFMLFKQKALQKWIIVFGIGVLISLLFKRFYCGWICPMGTLF
ncbi:MAG TPA: 4Fe-4S binding protein, partial [Halanaerobiales bacterium]|nr:4Fe-4S binding protein [Halanaerobiales bacterium]